jgi:hypothetical protein
MSLNRVSVKPGGVADAGLWDLARVHQNPNRVTNSSCRRTVWKVRPKRVTAPYSKHDDLWRDIPSNAGSEQAGVNLRRPLRKAKYS